MVAGRGEGGRLHSKDLGMRLWNCGGAGGEVKISSLSTYFPAQSGLWVFIS